MPSAPRQRRSLRTSVRGRCLGLKLRREFHAGALGPTSIELANGAATGAGQVPAPFFLEETYPSALLEAALEALGRGRNRPLIVCGGPGSGKSHTLAALHHCLESPLTHQRWRTLWDRRLERQPAPENLLRRGVQVLSKSLDHSGYQFLADYILGWHLRGEWARERWEAERSSPYENPRRRLLEAMFASNPAVLIFDGLEAWLEGLPEGGKRRLRSAALELITTLATIAAEHPDQLAVVASVENPSGKATELLAPFDPVVLDAGDEAFAADLPYRLVHRMFENRWEISAELLRSHLGPFVERHAALHTGGDPDRAWKQVLLSWPFAPGLVELIADRVDVEDPERGLRVLVRLLVDLFEAQPRRRLLISAADIGLTERDGGIADWLCAAMDGNDAVLRERAVDTLSRLQASSSRARVRAPHARAILTSMWVRSTPPRGGCRQAPLGASLEDLLLDVAHTAPVDPERFRLQVERIAAVALYVHEEDGRYCIREQPNPRSYLLAEALKAEHFEDGCDERELAFQIENVLGTRREVGSAFRLVVLPRNWRTDPWKALPLDQRPAYWDGRIALVAMPENPADDGELGAWLKAHVHERRNAVRFLLPPEGSPNLYSDPGLLTPARGMILARRWQHEDPAYTGYHEEFRLRLRDAIRNRFDRFALLDRWDEQDPRRSSFHVVEYAGGEVSVAEAVDRYVRRNLVEAGSFDDLLLGFARSTETVATLLRAAQEPARDGRCTVPWLGRAAVLDKLAELCATGRIALELPGGDRRLEACETGAHESAYKRIYDEIHKNPEIDKSWMKYRTQAGTGEAPAAGMGRSGADPGTGGSDTGAGIGGSGVTAGLQAVECPLSSSEEIYRKAAGADGRTRARVAALLEGLAAGARPPLVPFTDKPDK